MYVPTWSRVKVCDRLKQCGWSNCPIIGQDKAGQLIVGACLLRGIFSHNLIYRRLQREKFSMIYSNLWNQVIYFSVRIRIIPANNLQTIQVRDVQQYNLGKRMVRRLTQGSLYAGLHICVDHRFPRGTEHESDQVESNLKAESSPLDALALTV
jgi:hypothetical protein